MSSRSPLPLTACVVAFNEEDRIGDCLRSLAFCDQILVVDSHSTDRTREIARELGAEVVERDWPGYGAQKEFATRHAKHDWILSLDADERASARLQAEVKALRERGFGDEAGYSMPRLTEWRGAWIRHGTWWPDRQLRLFDRRRGRWTGHNPHDYVEIDGSVGKLRGEILHYSYRSLQDHLRTIDRYTEIMAQGMHERGRRASLFDVVARPAFRFFRFYVLKRGFLLGWRGLLLAYLVAYYVRLKYLRLYVMQHETPPPPPPER